MKFRAILYSPLLHFFVLGGLVFILYNFKNPPSDRPPGESVLRLTEANARKLADGFAATFQRPPTQEEYRNLVKEWVIEEASVREALALGFDNGDTVIRNRLRSKMEFLAEAPAAAMMPDDATLEAFYKANAGRFASPDQVSFEQILLPPGAKANDIEALKTKLESGADPTTLGSGTMLPPQVEDMSTATVEKMFGSGFGVAVAALPIRRWSGPVSSGYGAHLVRLAVRREEVLPPLDKVRDRVLAEWRADEARQMREEYNQRLLKRYTVELPDFEAKGQP
ncbi:peptidyl-prolyl cis-trans isomerase [Mycoplana rhizolycopersici]|uniref:Peptidyl-prolyl cis-trans isomerase n=1 Tax=Mycoplana rhizolycopersici TaxID=2746702 RepID=A0ABX2QJT1_9HYPH|nr:peptidyl-prolyl cis-trans isomerase [Rhizobium rhizolycopersici]